MLNSISLPLPLNNSDQESPTTSDFDDKEEESHVDFEPHYKKVKSPTAKSSNTVPEEELPMTPDTIGTMLSLKTDNKENGWMKIKTKD